MKVIFMHHPVHAIPHCYTSSPPTKHRPMEEFACFRNELLAHQTLLVNVLDLA